MAFPGNPLASVPWTRLKLMAARILFRPSVVAFRGRYGIIERGGVRYDVDLGEGLDLAQFLGIGLQRYIVDNRLYALPPEGIVLDVGAHCGYMSLPFARKVPRGRVFAFEPAHGAFGKLLRNLELNPALSPRIQPIQAYVTHRSGASPAGRRVYASWRVDGRAGGEAHPVHGGTLTYAEGVPSLSLDDFAADRGLDRVDFLKIDTDGHELEVLQGAAGLIGRFRPAIVFEMCGYLLRERKRTFADFHEILGPMGYRYYVASSGQEIAPDSAPRKIPAKAGVDVLALSGAPPR